MNTETSKPGKHGTLYLFAVTYRGDFEAHDAGEWRCWAYSSEHAIDLFNDGSTAEEGWIATSVKRVRR